MYQDIHSTLISRFRKEISQEIEDNRYSVSQGGLSDIVSYKEFCAKIEGLNHALSIFDELVKQLQTDDKD